MIKALIALIIAYVLIISVYVARVGELTFTELASTLAALGAIVLAFNRRE